MGERKPSSVDRPTLSAPVVEPALKPVTRDNAASSLRNTTLEPGSPATVVERALKPDSAASPSGRKPTTAGPGSPATPSATLAERRRSLASEAGVDELRQVEPAFKLLQVVKVQGDGGKFERAQVQYVGPVDFASGYAAALFSFIWVFFFSSRFSRGEILNAALKGLDRRDSRRAHWQE
jgi:hypothetical protein